MLQPDTSHCSLSRMSAADHVLTQVRHIVFRVGMVEDEDKLLGPEPDSITQRHLAPTSCPVAQIL